MPSGEFGQGPKKETVYNGPSPVMGGNYAGTATKPIKETVYGGPGAGNTVYGGPGSGGATYGPTRTIPVAANTAAVAKAANVFFLIAVFSLANTLLLSSGARFAMAIGLGITRIPLRMGAPGAIIVFTAIVIGIFVGLGIFARRGSSAAFLIGILFYGLDTVFLCVDGIALHIPSIIVHGILMAGMLRGYRLTRE